jgi:ATP-dependent RNA helicase DDX31/DBP7
MKLTGLIARYISRFPFPKTRFLIYGTQFLPYWWLYWCSILELGFGKALEDILEHLGSRSGAPDQNKSRIGPMQRQNLLLSATLNDKVNRLAKISLKNPMMIGLDDQKKRSNMLGNNHTSLLSDDEEDGILEKKSDLVEHEHDNYRLPAQLVQRYVKGSSTLFALN